MPYRRKPKASKFVPKRQEFTFKTGTKEPKPATPTSKRRPPL